jgi:hypothetical protein
MPRFVEGDLVIAELYGRRIRSLRGLLLEMIGKIPGRALLDSIDRMFGDALASTA